MDSKSKRQLEECVQRILEQGDLNLMTESKVRMLAQKETGIDLTDRDNRRVVSQVLETFLESAELDDDGQVERFQARNKGAASPAREPPARKSEQQGLQRLPDRRRLIAELSDSEDGELDRDVQREVRRTEARPPHERNAIQHDSHFDRDDEDVRKGGELGARSRRRAAAEQENESLDLDSEGTDGSEEVNEGGRSRRNSGAAVSNRRRPVNGRAALGSDEDEDEDEDEGEFARESEENSVLEEEQVGGMKKVLMRRAQRPAERRDISPERTELDSRGSSSDGERGKQPIFRSKKHDPVPERKRDLKGRDDERQLPMQTQEVKKQRNAKPAENDNGIVCQLSKNRWVTIQIFKGKALVSIREYYEKNGQMLPSTKGISLTVEQWQTFKDGIPAVDAALDGILK